MEKTIFEIAKMDCPSEENLIRMKLDGIAAIKHLDFDIPKRQLTIFHNGQTEEITIRLDGLNLNSTLLQSEQTDVTDFVKQSHQKRLLWAVLAINLSFFLIEMLTGLLAKSMGLIADSLDMLADSIVYGLSLFAVTGTTMRKKITAKIAGYFQMTLALVGFIEVIRRFIGSKKLPDFSTMIIVSTLALIANTLCLYLLQKSKDREAHMQASMIFTSNDIIINTGVIVAGLLVHWLNSNKPDLIIGTIVFIIVIQGAIRILKLGQ